MAFKKNSSKFQKRSVTTNTNVLNGNTVNLTLFKRALKQEMDKKQDIDRKQIHQSHAMLMYTHYCRGITTNLTTGSSTSDKVRLLSYKGTWTINNTASYDADCLTRIMVIQTKEEVNGGSDAWASSLGAGSLYLDSQSPFIVQGTLDSRKVQVLFDKTITQVRGTSASQVRTTMVPFSIKLDRDFQFKPASVQYGQKYNLYVITFSYQQGGNTGVTSLGGVFEDSVLLTSDSTI